ncbi:serine/threonine-protein kinase PRP4 homolog [Striga asiatica]|uniref:Serine/threonine-protein kinase PRP4 homolog n=1 Tax=Striga asiatica TaxID=4170 RepID=A0A5A7R949_STRAF|nr:serine/threonine-protein kinase PRP4 homolog [Striga asiatica]
MDEGALHVCHVKNFMETTRGIGEALSEKKYRYILETEYENANVHSSSLNSFAIYFNYGGYIVNIDGFLDFFGDNIHLVTGLDLDRFGFFDLVEEIDKLGCKEWKKILYKVPNSEEYKEIHDDTGVMEILKLLPSSKKLIYMYIVKRQLDVHRMDNHLNVQQKMQCQVTKRVRLVNSVGGPSTRSRSKNSVGGPSTRSRSKNSVSGPSTKSPSKNSVGGPSTKSPSKNSVGSPSSRSRSNKIQDCSVSGTQESVANKIELQFAISIT